MKILLFISLCLMALLTHAQQVITARVISASDSLPLPGAIIKIKTSNKIAVTDDQGMFSIKTPQQAGIMEVHASGYKLAEVRFVYPVPESMLIVLIQDETTLKEVNINTGYQKIPKERSTGSFTFIDNNLYNKQISTNVLDRLEGITSSLNVDRRTSKPGIMIRGLSTISGVKTPLVILDDFPYEGNIANINPNDVENITVLKDAAAASIWGTKAGNGVIVITTKKGKFNQPLSVRFSSSVSLTDKPDLMSLRQISSSDLIDVERMLFDKGYYTAQINSLDRPAMSPVIEILNQRETGTLTAQQADQMINNFRSNDVRNDFSRYFYQKAVNQQYALNLSGGSQVMSWNMSGGYDDNSSVLDEALKRLTLNYNSTFKFGKKVQLSIGTLLTQTESINGRPAYGNIGLGSGSLPQYVMLADKDGNPLSVTKEFSKRFLEEAAGNNELLDWTYIPLEDYKYSSSVNKNTDILTNVQLNYNIVRGLSTSVKYQYEQQEGNLENLQGQDSYSARSIINQFTSIDPETGEVIKRIPNGGILDASRDKLISNKIRGQINFNKQLNIHEISAIIGAELSSTENKGNSFRSYGYDQDVLTIGNVDYNTSFPNYVTGGNSFIPNTAGFSSTTRNIVSFYMNAVYTFKDIYSLSFSARRDASNIFGVNTNQKWTPLYSTGLSWNIGREKFFNVEWLPDLRLRATYGISGNIDPNRSAVSTFSYLGTSEYLGVPIARLTNYGNPELSWERVKMINTAIDFKTKDSRLSGSLEFYFKRGLDLFGTVILDYTGGAGSSIVKNVANMTGKGFDATIQSINIRGKFKWQSGLNFSFNQDKVTQNYYEPARGSQLISGITPAVIGNPGKPVYAIYAYKWGGLDPATGNPTGFINGEKSQNYQSLVGTGTKPEDLVYFGSALPVWFGSVSNTFSWKNISLQAVLIYKLGYYFRDRTISYNSLFAARTGDGEFAERWQKPGDELNTNVPSMPYPTNARRDTFYADSEIAVKKGDHLRLQYITLSYKITNQHTPKFPVKQLELFTNVSNVGILWRANKEGLDPDYPAGSIKTPKTLAIGLRAQL